MHVCHMGIVEGVVVKRAHGQCIIIVELIPIIKMYVVGEDCVACSQCLELSRERVVLWICFAGSRF